jgi:D-threo-aldose 1-dehydrogenase
MKTRSFTTRSGQTLSFPAMGFGTAPLGNLYAPLSDESARATLDAAWDVGCRTFDTAPFYGLGLSETRLNPFLRAHRQDGFLLSTKIGRLLKPCAPAERSAQAHYIDTPARRVVFDYSYDGVMRSVEDSLARLGVDRIDILLCHDIDAETHGSDSVSEQYLKTFMEGGYRALERLRADGSIKAFGAGLNVWQMCERLARLGDFDLFLMAGRYTLLEQDPLEQFLPLCRERQIGIICGGPYNSGILATGAVAGAFYNYEPAPPAILDRVRKIEQICQAHAISLSEAAIQFPLFHEAVLCVIPGGKTPEEVKRNARHLQKPIPPALWVDLKTAGLIAHHAPTS